MRSSILQEEPVVEEPIAPVVTAKQEEVVAPIVEKVDIAPIVAEEVKPEASETAPSA